MKRTGKKNKFEDQNDTKVDLLSQLSGYYTKPDRQNSGHVTP